MIGRFARQWCAALAVAASSHAAPSAAPAPDEFDPAWLEMTACPREPGCPAIVLTDETTINNAKIPAVLTRRRVVKVFTTEGAQWHSDLRILDPTGRESVRKLTGRTRLPDGTSVPLGKNHISLAETLKQGRRRIRATTARFPGVIPGSILEANWEMADSRAVVYAWFPWELQEEIPVLKATMTLRTGRFGFAWVQEGLYRPIIHFTEPSSASQVFTVRDLPSLPEEPLSPDSQAVRARILFFSQDFHLSWLRSLAAEVGARMERFLEDRGESPAKAREITAGEPDVEERLRSIYRFVQRDIAGEEARGDAEREPELDGATAGAVLKRGYGDPFEKSMLLYALAEALEIEVDLVVIASRERGVLASDAPDVSRFDSFAIRARSSEEWIYLDPGPGNLPFGMVAASSESPHPNALALSPKSPRSRGGKLPSSEIKLIPETHTLFAIPVSAPASNTEMRHITATLSPDGTGEVQARFEAAGHAGAGQQDRYSNLAPEDRHARLASDLQGASPDLTLLDAEFEGLDGSSQPFALRFRAALPRLATAAGDRLLVQGAIFEQGWTNPFTARSRVAPVEFPHTVRRTEVATIRVPAGYVVAGTPAAQTFTESGLYYSATWSQEGAELVHRRILEIGGVSWSADAYARLREFFARVQEADRKVAVLQRSDS